jgi:predicted metal-dependent hydrolase
MRLSFTYGTKNIAFNVAYKKRKTLEISVEPPDIINVVAPLDTSEEMVLEKVKAKAHWIVQKLYSLAPSPVLDYIIVHELCHLYEKGHSRAFWDMVAAVLPDYERRKEWLKNNGVRLDLVLR